MFRHEIESLLHRDPRWSSNVPLDANDLFNSARSFRDNFLARTTAVLNVLSVPDFATSIMPIISGIFPRATSTAHVVLLGAGTVVDAAVRNISHPNTLRLVREQSIDHQIIYIILHHLVNHEDIALTLRKPTTKLEHFLKRGVTYCFSLGPKFLSSIIESTPPPWNVALIQNMFRTALFLGDGPILNLIMDLSQEDLVNRLVLLEGTHYYPVLYTSYFGHVQATQVLLDSGADLDVLQNRDIFDFIGSMPYFQKPSAEVRPQILRLLISRGFKMDVDVVRHHMRRCSMDELQIVITYFLDDSFRVFFGKRNLPLVVDRADWDDSFSETLRAIVKQASITAIHHRELWDSVLSDALSCAISRNYAFAVDVLLRTGATLDSKCMIGAVQSSNLRILEDCLDRGIDPNIKIGNRTALSEAIKNHSRGPIQMLQARGSISKLACQSSSFVSAFTAACQIGDIALVEYLLSLQAFPWNLAGITGSLEAALENNQHPVVEMLTTAGITPTMQCFELAIQNKQLAAFKILADCTDLFAMPQMRGLYQRNFVYKDVNRLYDNAMMFGALQWGDSTVIEHVLAMEYPVDALFQLNPRHFSEWDLAPKLYPPGYNWTWFLTPLSAAILKGNRTAMDALMAHGVQAVSFNCQHASYQTPFLTENERNVITLTPLAAGVIRNDIPLVESLLRLGADPFDNGALFVCAVLDMPDIAALLLFAVKSRYPHGQRSFGCDALYQIIRRKNLRMLKLLANEYNIIGLVQEDRGPLTYPDQRPRSNTIFTTPLGEAVRLYAESNGVDDALDFLLSQAQHHNAIVFRDSHRGNMTCVLYAIFLDSLKTVQKLHQTGASMFPPAQRNILRTQLQAAVEAGSTEIVEYLLNQGVSANEPPSKRAGATALQLAAITGNINIATILLKAEADINAPPAFFNGRTAFEGATEHGRIEMMIFLVGEGADLLANNNEQYRRAIAFAEQNRQYAAKSLADDLYAKVLVSQQAGIIGMDGEWAAPDMPDFGSFFS